MFCKFVTLEMEFLKGSQNGKSFFCSCPLLAICNLRGASSCFPSDQALRKLPPTDYQVLPPYGYGSIEVIVDTEG